MQRLYRNIAHSFISVINKTWVHLSSNFTSLTSFNDGFLYVVDALSDDVTSFHILWRHVTVCDVMSHSVTSCHMLWFYSIYVLWRHVTCCDIIPHIVTSCHVTLIHWTTPLTIRCWRVLIPPELWTNRSRFEWVAHVVLPSVVLLSVIMYRDHSPL